MKRLLTLTLVVCLSAAAVYGEVRGSWTASPNENRGGELQMNLTRRSAGWFTGNTFKLAEFSGLTAAQINATAQTPVQFAIRAEAGVIDFEGVFRNGEGAGQFRFTPNTNMIASLRNLGLELDRDEKDEDELFNLALHGVTTDYIRTMRSEGFNEPLEDYVGMRAVGVTSEYIRDMRQLFKRNDLGAEDLTGMRAVGVTRQYVESMRTVGMNLTDPEDVTGLRAVGVTAEYVRDMRDAGFRIDDPEDATSLKALGVTPEYFRAMRAIFPDVETDELSGLKAVGVTADYVRDMRAAGVRVDDAEEVTSMKAVGVSVAFVKELAAAGYKNLTPEQLTSMKAVGVDQKFIRDMSKYRDKN